MKNFLLGLALIMALVVFGEKQPYRRYQSVVDRQMFGPLPENFDPTKMPSEVAKSERSKELTKEQEKLQSAIRFSVINVTPDGETRVGFTDNSDAKVPMHYYLKVGEERNGWKVLSADAETATMTVAKGDIEVSLTIGGNSAQGGTTSRLTGDSAQAKSRSDAPRTSSLLGSSLRANRKLRAEKMAQERAELEELRKREAADREEQRMKDEAAREEQRKQLQAIQETISTMRKEQQTKDKDEELSSEGSGNGNNEAE